MAIFDIMNTAGGALNLYSLKSEVAAENIMTPGKHKEVLTQAAPFNSVMSDVAGDKLAKGGGSGQAIEGAVQVTGVRTTEATGSLREQNVLNVFELMEAKSAYDLNIKVASMARSMAMAGLEINNG